MHKSDKQRARDAYAAGMGDPLVTAAPAAVAGPSDPSITLDFKQATELLKMFGGEPGLVTLQHGNERSHSGAGLYAWYSDLPEEGAVFLGAEPDDEAAPTAQPAPQQSGVGNSGFDHKTAADFLTGKTVSDEAVRKFVAASRWTHNDRAGLQEMLLTVCRELASRKAEIALLKTALMNAEEAPQQEAPDNHHQCRLLTRAELDALGAKAEGMDGNQWDMWVQEQFARANRLKIEGSNYD